MSELLCIQEAVKSSSSPDDLCNEVSEAFPAENVKVHHSPVSYHTLFYIVY